MCRGQLESVGLLFGTTVGGSSGAQLQRPNAVAANVFRLNRAMLKRLFAGTVLALLFNLQGLAQSHSNFPVDIIAGPAPQAMVVDGRARVAYELRFTNFAPFPIELTGIDVLDVVGSFLANYRGEELEKLVVPGERAVVWAKPTEGAAKARVIGEGHSAVIFFDLTLAPDVGPPAELHHRFSFSFEGNNGAAVERTVDAPVVAVVQQPAVLRPPLRGASWVAFNAFSNGSSPDHRRAFNAIDGRIHIAQRFAIDWMRLGSDGRLSHGDSKSNANFYDYGAEVLAVADGRVSDLKDGLPDNVGSNERSSRVITLDNMYGNYLTLDLGKGHFALYAHLKPGSLRAKLGDTVKVGQVLALLGNSGNSDAPHLHFQLMDANSPAGAEGIAYELETFLQLGVVDDDPAVQGSEQVLLRKTQEKPTVHRREFPVANAAVTFP
jgi:murein DD-endopeptidase